MNTCIKCGCDDAYPSLPPCPTPEGCPNPQPCAEFFDAECVRFTLPDIECGTDTVVFQDDTLAEALDNIISYFCQRLVTLTNYINAQLAIINNRLTNIEGDIVDIKGDIVDIKGDIVDIKGDIVDIQGDIVDIQGDIVDIQGDITNIEGDITTINTLLGEAMPVGSVIPWAGQSSLPLPNGWLPCDGSLQSTTTYAALFTVIGDEYGTGAPIGQFYMPNLIDANPYGNNQASVGTVVGDNAISGSASVPIGIGNMPLHNHSLSAASGATLSIGESGSHKHNIFRSDGTCEGSYTSMDADWVKNSDYEDCDNPPEFDIFMTPETHTHDASSFSGNTADGGGVLSPTPAIGTISGDNRQRGISMRYMIKY